MYEVNLTTFLLCKKFFIRIIKKMFVVSALQSRNLDKSISFVTFMEKIFLHFYSIPVLGTYIRIIRVKTWL